MQKHTLHYISKQVVCFRKGLSTASVGSSITIPSSETIIPETSFNIDKQKPNILTITNPNQHRPKDNCGRALSRRFPHSCSLNHNRRRQFCSRLYGAHRFFFMLSFIHNVNVFSKLQMISKLEAVNRCIYILISIARPR